jgi:hypothetical protein
MKKQSKVRLCSWIVYVAFVNFAVFWFATVFLGGSAIGGKFEDGHFYLSSKGRYVEVSQDVFTFSRWHAYTMFGTHVLAFVAGYFYYRLGTKRDV